MVKKTGTRKKAEKKEEAKPARSRLVGHPIADVSEKWSPEPKIDVEPPKDADAICQRQIDPYTKCTHVKSMHYGGQKGYCNTSGCTCMEFKK